MLRILISIIAAIVLTACAEKNQQPTKIVSADQLATVLVAQPEDIKARYAFRNPQQTIEFFGIEPGMTVVEALPGGGWYSKILVPYLGEKGTLIGVDYAQAMWPKFGFFSDQQIEEKKTWVNTWTEKANSWHDQDGATVKAFVFGSMPDEFTGTADAVLFIRALHNLNRFENDGGFLTTALSNTYQVLKPGGIVGIVQHSAPSELPDKWADGSKGYLKETFLIAKMKEAGFELVDSSDINANPKDQPTDQDIVWRLPPSLATSRDNPELKAQMQAIGESNRMTLKFRKPK
ncbi:MAG: methyltransferase [Porticoccaceae bacterium]|nr:methyltransferase [Porticoccaceae bacterium]